MFAGAQAGAIRRSGGWTLVELVVVLTVAGMLLMMALPMLSSMLANGRVRSAAESLQDGLGVAQAEALRRSTNVELIVTDGNPLPANVTTAAVASGRNWLVRIPADATRGLAATTFVRGSTAFERNGPTLENRGGAVSVAYSPTGRLMQAQAGGYVPATSAAVFRITGNGADRPLCVYSTISGSVKTCDPALNGSDFRACQPAITTSACPAAPVNGG